LTFFSAGSHPSRVHPLAIEVMNEWGINISNHTSDPIHLYLDKGIDIVITVCDHAAKVCPTFPGDVERLHWSIKDPFAGWGFKEDALIAFRETRDTIQRKIDHYLKSRMNKP